MFSVWTDIWVARYGQVVAKVAGPDYAFHYADLVNGLRAVLPGTVRFVVGRVGDIATGDDVQSVTMADGTVLKARLIIVATGLGDSIRSRVSIERVRLSRAHSLSLGFDLTVKPRELPFASLVYYGNGPSDRLAYFTLFPIGDTATGEPLRLSDGRRRLDQGLPPASQRGLADHDAGPQDHHAGSPRSGADRHEVHRSDRRPRTIGAPASS